MSIYLLEVHEYYLWDERSGVVVGGRISWLDFSAELAGNGRFQVDVDVLRLLYVGLLDALEEVLQRQGVAVGAILVK